MHLAKRMGHLCRPWAALLLALGMMVGCTGTTPPAIGSDPDPEAQAPPPERPGEQAPPPFPAPSLTYYSLGREQTLPAGERLEVVGDTMSVRMRFDTRVDPGAVRAHLEVTPAELVREEPGWFDQPGGGMLQIVLGDLPLGQPVTLRLKAGLTAAGTRPLERDHTWQLVRVEPTTATVTVTARAPGMLAYPHRDGGFPYVALPGGPLTLELRFSGPMDEAAVEQYLRTALHPAPDLKVEWPEATRAVARATLAFDWNRHGHIALDDVPDARGLPVQTVQGATVRVDGWRSLHRWTPEAGSVPVGRLPGGMEGFPDRGQVSRSGLLLWHHLGDDGDAYIRAPALLLPDHQTLRPIGPAQSHVHHLAAYWLPGRDTAVISARDHVALINAAGAPVDRLTTGSDTPEFIMGMAVNPSDGRIAVFAARWRDQATGPRGLIDLVVLSPAGQVLLRLPEISWLGVSDSFPQPVDSIWLPDGRLAFVRWGPGPNNAAVRTLALVDPAAGQVLTTDVELWSILDLTPDGKLVLDQGRRYDPSTGELDTLPVPEAAIQGVALYSPDGQWLAGYDNAQNAIWVWQPGSQSLQRLGPGQLIGWGPDGALYWLGEPER